MKKRFLIICVNYNTYDDLYHFLRSVNEAAAFERENYNIEVVVVDNSDKKELMHKFCLEFVEVKYLPIENLGYLGGAFYAIKYYDYKVSEYDFMIISNVDVVVDMDFFKNIVDMNVANVGWIIPSERTLAGVYLNPYMNNRPSRIKIHLLIFMYKHPVLLWLNQIRSKFKDRKCLEKDHSLHDTYAGHGSMFILANSILRSVPSWKYPTFMYGEEIFMGEMMLKYGLRVVYNPKIVINSIGGVSTGKIPSKMKRKWSLDSLAAIKEMFWSN